jgi:plastocyanin
MFLRSALFACALSAFAASSGAPAYAGDLSVTVTTPDGKPLADAVITLPAPAGAAKPAFPWKLEVAQKDKTFVPFVLVAPVSANVAFPNLDKFRHHVYSFSKGNKFELELYGKEDKRTVAFKTAGTAAIGCNIHDEMVGFIRVVDTPFAAKTNENGLAEIKDAPDGATKLTVWHPYARAKDQIAVSAVTIAPGANSVSVVLDLAPKPKHH